ncbi:MAG: hypothetical protein Q7R39_19765 [Dehalococcoidia bacterium]|nr:hypothetical protein [Dehalococcoidia bacterium]
MPTICLKPPRILASPARSPGIPSQLRRGAPSGFPRGMPGFAPWKLASSLSGLGEELTSDPDSAPTAAMRGESPGDSPGSPGSGSSGDSWLKTAKSIWDALPSPSTWGGSSSSPAPTIEQSGQLPYWLRSGGITSPTQFQSHIQQSYPGSVPQGAMAELSFFEAYKTPIVIGGLVVGAVVLALALKRK